MRTTAQITAIIGRAADAIPIPSSTVARSRVYLGTTELPAIPVKRIALRSRALPNLAPFGEIAAQPIEMLTRAAFTSAQKRGLLTQLEHKSSHHTEGLFAAISPQAVPREPERLLNEKETSVTFVAPARLTEKLGRLRGLLAHRNASPSYAELFEILADIALEKLDPSVRTQRALGAPNNLEKPSAQASSNPVPCAHPGPTLVDIDSAHAKRVYSLQKPQCLQKPG